ncbi:MAG: tetratricopeptide repeat protein [Thermoanaerobaculia bacterium]
MIAAFLLVAALGAGLPPGPRPVSDAERAATVVVMRYFASGPTAVLEEMSDASPIRKLPKADALREIEARFGPRAKSRWSMDTAVPSIGATVAIFTMEFPSGLDDTVAFEMVESGGKWKVEGIRTSAEPVARKELLPRTRSPAGSPALRSSSWPAPVSLILPAALLAVLGVAMGRRDSRIVLAIEAVGVIAGIVVLIEPLIPRKQSAAALAAETKGIAEFVRIGELVDLRRKMAAGAGNVATPSAKGRTNEVALLWTAALDLRHERYAQVRAKLEELPDTASYPMAELLRARLGYLEKKDIEAVAAYERAIDLGPGRDSLWLEAAEVLSILGFDERAEGYLDRTAASATRDPDVYYMLATIAGMQDQDKNAEKLLLAAWDMKPAERSQVVRTALLWRVIRQPKVAKTLALHNVSEAAFATQADRPLPPEPGLTAEVSGAHLRLRAGEGEIDVPGGASIAPQGAVVLDAGAWRRRGEEQALLDFDAVRERATSAAAFADPSYRDRCLATVYALADRNRWQDILTLTSAFPPRDERVPLELMVMRGQALTRLEQPDELRRLVAGLLANPSFRRKKDPSSMQLIAELLASIDDHDPAIRLLEHAREQKDLQGMSFRIEQLVLERKLAGSYRVQKSKHFEVHYPEDTDAAGITRLTEILEKEQTRLTAAWFPGMQMRPVVVNVLWWQDFARYSGSPYIAGLFTNKIFLPLAGVDNFMPPIVSIMTHELFHAMLADATKNLAPRWFHEAMASRVEMNEVAENGFQKYRDDRYLSVSLLDAVANGSPDPDLIMEAYSLGESTVRYIEAKHGRGAITKMIAAFRNGADTEAAVRAGAGMTIGELDGAARAWGNAQPVLFEGKVIYYDDSDKVRGTVSQSPGRERRW